MIREYKTIREVAGPLMVVKQVEGVTYDELGELELPNGELRRCKVLEVNGDTAVVQLFEKSAGINLRDARSAFWAIPLELACPEDMLGRVFDGMGEPIDGGPEISGRRASGHQRSAHEPRRPRLPQRVHPDGHLHDRRSEHPGPRPEAAHLLRLRPAPRRAGRADRPPGQGARRRLDELRRRVRRHRHHL